MPVIRKTFLGLIVIAVFAGACMQPVADPRAVVTEVVPASDRKMKEFEEFVEDDHVSYLGYQAVKLHKRVRINGFPKAVEITDRNGPRPYSL